MKILVINLTRMGDLVQTLGLIGGLRQVHPKAELHYLAMSSFAGILDLFEGIDRVWTLDAKALVEDIATDFPGAYVGLHRKVSALNAEKFDILVNPVVSIQSSLLGHLIGAKVKLGMFYSSQREQRILSEWTAFHLANEHFLGDHGFNLVDIFARVGKVPARHELYRLHPTPGDIAHAGAFLRGLGWNPARVIGFHIGASQSNKAWEPEKFRTVIANLISRGDVHVILFGGYKEEGLGDLFSDMRSPNFHNHIGKTGISELTALIAGVALLVTNDTGPMHLAAAMGVPILNLSLGPVSLWETGPYCTNALIIQPDVACHPCAFSHPCTHWECHYAISPDLVSRLAVAMLEGIPVGEIREKILLWHAQPDIFGLQHFVPHRKRILRDREAIFEIKRAVWAMTLIPGLDERRDWATDWLAYLCTYYTIQRPEVGPVLDDIEVLYPMAEKISSILDALARIRGTDKKSIDKIKSLFVDIKTAKEAMLERAKLSLGLFDFFQYAQFRESGVESDDYNRLARHSARIYGELALQLKVMARCLKMLREIDASAG